MKIHCCIKSIFYNLITNKNIYKKKKKKDTDSICKKS